MESSWRLSSLSKHRRRVVFVVVRVRGFPPMLRMDGAPSLFQRSKKDGHSAHPQLGEKLN
jgi:hypothetical protein